jgi:hypothetical protein
LLVWSGFNTRLPRTHPNIRCSAANGKIAAMKDKGLWPLQHKPDLLGQRPPSGKLPTHWVEMQSRGNLLRVVVCAGMSGYALAIYCACGLEPTDEYIDMMTGDVTALKQIYEVKKTTHPERK